MKSEDCQLHTKKNRKNTISEMTEWLLFETVKQTTVNRMHVNKRIEYEYIHNNTVVLNKSLAGYQST